MTLASQETDARLSEQLVYYFGDGGATTTDRTLLGGKGAGLAEMSGLGIPVPPGFTITTEVCSAFYRNGRQFPAELASQVEEGLRFIEEHVGTRFGDADNPLLVSVRSGARVSMPGMMDTILNLGLNDTTAAGLIKRSGNARFVYDSYRRFVQMYGDVVLGVGRINEHDHDPFEVLLNAKKKAIDEYRENLKGLQQDFDKFRPEKIENTSPQEFTDLLVKADSETRAAFEQAGTTVPDAYFCGFERYKTELARSNATGILTYELVYVRQLMQELAKAGINELKNVHRPALAEENGAQFQPGPNDVARAMPLEVTFSGTEESVRKFFTALANPENGFAVVRSLRVSNSKRGVPPKAGDAKFDSPTKAAPAAEIGRAHV